MGISYPSLYAAGGDTKEVFRQAIWRYARVQMVYVDEALARAAAYEVVAYHLRSPVEATTLPGRPAGHPENQPVTGFLAASRRPGEAHFAEPFRRAVDDGDLPATQDPADLARCLLVVTVGAAVQASGGATRSRPEAVMEGSCLPAYSRRLTASIQQHRFINN